MRRARQGELLAHHRAHIHRRKNPRRDEQHARSREVERTLQDLHRKLDSALGAP